MVRIAKLASLPCKLRCAEHVYKAHCEMLFLHSTQSARSNLTSSTWYHIMWWRPNWWEFLSFYFHTILKWSYFASLQEYYRNKAMDATEVLRQHGKSHGNLPLRFPFGVVQAEPVPPWVHASWVHGLLWISSFRPTAGQTVDQTWRNIRKKDFSLSSVRLVAIQAHSFKRT